MVKVSAPVTMLYALLLQLLLALTFAAPLDVPTSTADAPEDHISPLSGNTTALAGPWDGPFFDHYITAVEHCVIDKLSMGIWLEHIYSAKFKAVLNTYSWSLATEINKALIELPNEEMLSMDWNYVNGEHGLWFSLVNADSECQWGMNVDSATRCGHCQLVKPWSGDPIDRECKQGNPNKRSRRFVAKCWVNLGWGNPDPAHKGPPSTSGPRLPISTGISHLDKPAQNKATRDTDVPKSIVKPDEAIAPATEQSSLHSAPEKQLIEKSLESLNDPTTYRYMDFLVTEYCPDPYNDGLREASVQYQENNQGWLALPNVYKEGKTVRNQVNARSGGPPFVIGPYDHKASRLWFTYNSCAFSQDHPTNKCGSCVQTAWSGIKAPYCATSKRDERTHKFQCKYALNLPNQVESSEDLLITPSVDASNITKVDNTPSPTITADDHASTLQTLDKKDALPQGIPESQWDIRHVSLNITEWCFDFRTRSRALTVLYKEENDEWSYLPEDYSESRSWIINQMDVRGASGHPFLIGPYDWTSSAMIFSYRKCWWNQYRTGQVGQKCGSCVSQPWSNPAPIDCVNGVLSRTIHVECSFPVNWLTDGWQRRDIAPASTTALQTTTTVLDVHVTPTAVLEKKDAEPMPMPQGIPESEWDIRHITLNITEYCSDPDGKHRALSVLFREENDEWFYLPETYEDTKTTKNHMDVRGASGVPLIIGPYDWVSSAMIFSYKKWWWNQDRGSKYGVCNAHPWDNPAGVDCADVQSRFHQVECWFPVNWKDIAPHRRDITSQPIATHEPSTVPAVISEPPQVSTTDIIQTASDIWAMYPFTVRVTEYCDGTPGHPLKAKVLWIDLSNRQEHITLHNPRMKLEIFLEGFGENTGDGLMVGPYDFDKSQIRFSYKGCEWDQDNDRQWCGYCVGQPWNQKAPLACPGNPWIERWHDVNCWFAVARSTDGEGDEETRPGFKVVEREE